MNSQQTDGYGAVSWIAGLPVEEETGCAYVSWLFSLEFVQFASTVTGAYTGGETLLN